jgi:hypothetical protein
MFHPPLSEGTVLRDRALANESAPPAQIRNNADMLVDRAAATVDFSQRPD